MTTLVDPQVREQRKIHEIAREYRRGGYEVLVKPERSQVPDFLGDYQPDLIVRNGQESVVIEVKSLRGFDRSKMTHDVASRVSSQLGWRFELIVTNARHGRATDEPGPWDLPVVDKHLRQVRGLMDTGQLEPAFLLLWADTEALLRRVAEQEELSVRNLSSPQIVKQLAFQGLVDRDDYVVLEDAASRRNGLAHGVGSEIVDPQLVKRLLAVTEGLREEIRDGS